MPEVYSGSERAITTAREKHVVVMEYHTYRIGDHVGLHDNIQGTHTDIRPKSEKDKWREKDPVETFESYLLENEIMTTQDILGISEKIEAVIKQSLEIALNNPKPELKEVGKYVFK